MEFKICIALIGLILKFGVASAQIKTETFDFVIVGGGTSGCVLARRLAETNRFSVLLIEIGGEPLPDQEIPALQAQFMFNPIHVNSRKTYETIPQVNAARSNNGIISLITGRALGGGSTLNGQIYNRGSPHDFNLWAQITNDSSWNYQNLLHYFKKIENYKGSFHSDQHGYSGPITLTSPEYGPAKQEWLQAGRELGLPTGDPNGPQIPSFTKVDFAKNFGRRVSSYTGYLTPVIGKLNRLKISTFSEATRILFSRNIATGILYRKDGANFIAWARKEVILSLGAIATPHLLMKSGVGPKWDLEQAKIPLVKDLPVGQCLFDHPVIPVFIVLNNESCIFSARKDLNRESWDFYNKFGDGPYSSTIGLSGQAFLKSSLEKGDWADIQLHNYNLPLPHGPHSNLGFGEVYANWSTSLGRPKGHGSIRLNLNDANADPIIDVGFLYEPDDLQVAADGAKWIVRICEETRAFKKLGCRVPGPLKECAKWGFKTNNYWKCYSSQFTESGYHYSGTCKMGRVDDPKATVDSKLRVIGIEGLRVVDASVMPAIVNANTQSAVYVIAEKAADMILNDY